MMKASGFEIPLATSLSKFGRKSSIQCAFLRRSFLKHLQISVGETDWNENLWVVRIDKFFGIFHIKTLTGCRVWSSFIAILEKNLPNPLVIVSLFDISSSFTLNVVQVSFDFGLVWNKLFNFPQNEVAFLIFSFDNFCCSFVWLF